MARLGDVYNAYRNGGPISDADLTFAIEEFTALTPLFSLGPRFALAACEVQRVRDGLILMKEARSAAALKADAEMRRNNPLNINIKDDE